MATEAKAPVIERVPLNEIYSDDEFNCRGSIAPIDVLELSKSIRAVGLQQAIVIQPWDKTPGKKYRIVMGHRRFKATTLLPEAKTINAVIEPGLSELEARKLNLMENLGRKDLNIMQEAMALKPFLMEGWQQKRISQELEQSRGWVQVRLDLLKLPPEIQKEASAGFLNQEHIRQIAQLKTLDQKFEAVRDIKEAKIRQDKRQIDIGGKKSNPLTKRRRDRSEVFEMMENVSKVVGFCFATECLAWANGETSDFEQYQALKRYAELLGIPYEIPAEFVQRVREAAGLSE